MVFAFFVLILIVFCIFISTIISSLSSSSSFGTSYEEIQKKEIKYAGNFGEKIANKVIKQALNREDYLLNNVKLNYEGQKTELDNLIINKYGIFIIEVKYYVGRLEGDIDDYEWIKYKDSYDDTFVKNVKNPIKQVNREVFILSKVLKENSIYNWINGYVYFVNNNSPVDDKAVLNDVDEIIKVLHTSNRKLLSENEIKTILAVIRNLNS